MKFIGRSQNLKCTFRSGQGLGLPRWLSGKEPACQFRKHKRCRFDPWVGTILWKRKWQPTPVFLPGESHGQRSWWATVHEITKESDKTNYVPKPGSHGCLPETHIRL